MKKIITILCLLACCNSGKAQLAPGQFYTYDYMTGLFGIGWMDLNTNNAYRYEDPDSTTWDYSNAWHFQSIDYTHNTGAPQFVVTTDSFGRLKSCRIDSLYIQHAGKRRETYSGTTNASGVYTVSFATAYAAAPNIQANIVNQSATNQFLRVSSVSTTGFTVNAFQRSSVTLLGIDLLLFATTNVNGASVDVIITEK